MLFVAAAVLLLLAVAALVLGLRAGRGNGEISSALRELLLARAEGRVDAEEFERRQAALHAALLQTPPASGRRWHLAALTAAVAGAALGLYAGFGGTPSAQSLPAPASMAATPAATPAAMPAATPAKPTGGDLREMAKRLAEKLAREPNNGEGWILLARAYRETQQFKEADAAFAKADKLAPLDAAMLADWADTRVMARDRKWDDSATEIVNRALMADPKHLKALALAGSAAYGRADYRQAVAYWTRMKAAAPAGSMEAKEAETNMAEAKKAMGGAGK